MTKHTAIYLRVSTLHQDTAAQLGDITRYEQTVDGPVKRYEDRFTGRSMERPEFQKLVDAIDRGEVERVVVWRLDRLGRTCLGVMHFLDKLKKKGVKFLSLRDGFDPDTVTGKLVANVLASIAEFECELRRERQMAAIASLRERVAKVREMAAQGVLPDTIAAEMGMPIKRVLSILSKKDGLWWGGRRPGQKGRRNITHAQVVAYVRRGLTSKEIAKLTGDSVRTVERRIADLGGMDAIRSGQQEQ